MLRHFVGDFVKACKFSEEEVFDLVLAAGEACSNALIHGSPLGSENLLTVECACDPKKLQITVIDEGIFLRTIDLNDEGALKCNGRGILIMTSVMDKVEINESDSGTSVVLIKKHSLDKALFKRKKPVLQYN